MSDYFGDKKFIRFLLKPRLNQKGHFSSFSELMEISKQTFEHYRQKDSEAFFICAQEFGENNFVWYWEFMPDVLIWKRKYSKPLHTVFKKYLQSKLDDTGRIFIFIAHINHPNYIVFKYFIPNKDYIDGIDLLRTYKMDFASGVGNIKTPPLGKNLELTKIGIKDNIRRFNIYYVISKYSLEVIPF